MDALTRCEICGALIGYPQRLCFKHSEGYKKDKSKKTITKRLKNWWKVLTGRGASKRYKAEKKLLEKEEDFDEITFMVGCMQIRLDTYYWGGETVRLDMRDVHKKPYLKKFDSLRLPKIIGLSVDKYKQKDRKAYEKYFSPLKHDIISLTISANNEGDRLCWVLPLIVGNAQKLERLTLNCFSISMKELKRIFVASDSIKNLSFERCNFLDTTSLELIVPPAGWEKRRKAIQEIQVSRCTFSETLNEFEQMIRKFYPKADIQIKM
ncbi:unnamed protein product [Moneuplotes crassus]|uniref:Uncharacterized protein n=1 Tax=Euplotes crassus TaxID=5936 RepID=A0AAD1XQU9_EUPCR|nr:unnamed protein product [Moneuplotes crassus]